MSTDAATLAKRDHRRQRYEHYSSYPLFIVSLLFLVGFVIIIDPQTHEEDLGLARGLMWISWLAFLIDYVIGLALAADRRHYVGTHKLQALGVLVPPLRILLIGRVFQTMTTGNKRKFGGRVRVYALYLTTLAMVLAAILVVAFERDAPGANITSFGDAIWWTSETVSTVGYGDFYPVTMAGRIVAVVLFVNGIALLSAVTATIAERVLDYDNDAEEETDTNLVDLHNRLVSIEKILATMAASQVGSGSAGSENDGSATGGPGPTNS